MRKKYKLNTTIEFNGREIDIELRGDYTPYRKASYMDPPEGDEMELTEIMVRKYTNGLNHGNYTETDIIDLFTKEELEEFNDQLYSNGEEIE